MYINKFNKIAIEYTLWSYPKIILNQIKLLQKKLLIIYKNENL